MSLHQYKIANIFSYYSKKTETTVVGGFHPNWVCTLNIGVHVGCLCVMLYSSFTTLSNKSLMYDLRSTHDKLSKSQVLWINVGFSNHSCMCTLVHFIEVAYINLFGK